MNVLIQIDDAGSGSLIGGTCIGVIRVETLDYYYEIIPINLYNESNFRLKLYLDYVVEIVRRLFKELRVKKDEPIEVCRGYMFDRLRKWLKNEEYNYSNVQIQEPLQSNIERTFEQYAIDLGLPENFIRYTKYPFHFHRILKWVYADIDNRKIFCKTGWKSWKKYSNLDTKVSFVLLTNSNYVCLKCGGNIVKKSIVKKISYTSNKPTDIYLHENC